MFDEEDPMFAQAEEVVAELVQVSPAIEKHSMSKRVKQLQDKVLQKATMVMDAAHRFGEVDPNVDMSTPEKFRAAVPAEWIEAYGRKEATERFRIAHYALLGPKEAPVGLKIANSTMQSIMKIQAAEKTGDRQINVALVMMPAANLSMPELEVKE